MGKTSTVKIRLDPELDQKIRHVAALKGLTFSAVCRLALAEYCEREWSAQKESRYDDAFYDSIFGALDGPRDLAARSGKIFGQIMDEKHRPRGNK